MDEQDIQDCLGESRVLQFRESFFWIINIDAQDIQDIQDFVLGVCSALIPGIRNPASDHLADQHLVQHPFVQLILYILCIDVHKQIPIARAYPTSVPPHQPSPEGAQTGNTP